MLHIQIERRLNGVLRLLDSLQEGQDISVGIIKDAVIDIIIDLNNELPQEEEENK